MGLDLASSVGEATLLQLIERFSEIPRGAGIMTKGHDWIEGHQTSAGGTTTTWWDYCSRCGLRRQYNIDWRYGIPPSTQRKYVDRLGAELTEREAANRGCE